MRDPRYRFSDDVRAATRAVALRMVRTGAVAASPEELERWIASTDDIRERLAKGGYGSRFNAADLFPLYEGQIAKATAAAPRRPQARRSGRTWTGILIATLVVIVAIVVAVMSR